MSVWQLLCGIKAALEPGLAALPLPIHGRNRDGEPFSEDGAEIPPRTCAVYLGSMPPTENDAFSAAPFVVIQPMSGQNTADHLHNVIVAIRVCIVSHDLEEAENDLHNLISRIRLSLLSLPGGVVGKGRWRLVADADGVPWERPDAQVYPFLQAHIFTNWQTAGVFNVPV